MRRWVAIFVGLACAGLFGWLAFRQVEWATVGAAMRAADWRMLGLVPPLMLSSLVFRALRWRLLLAEHPGARLGPLTLAAGIGIGANNLLPAKLGEAVGAHALGRLADLSRIQSLGILVVTRVADLLVLFTLVLIASFVLPAPETRAYQTFSVAVVGLCGLALGSPLLLRFDWALRLVQAARRAAERLAGPGPIEFAAKFARGLTSAGRVRRLLAFIGSTALLWLVLSSSLFVALRAFNIEVAPWLVPLFLGMMAASAMLPSGPANIGTFHFFGMLALRCAGVAPDLAAACVIAYHAIDMVFGLLLGAACGAIARTSLFLWRTPAPEVIAARCAPADGLMAPGTSLSPALPSAAVGPGPLSVRHPAIAGERA